jgi:asparagine synthase (glutamine-hydrolysing)
MGGLAGIIHFDGTRPDPAVLARMSDVLRHRGPDGEGSWLEDSAGLAHRLRRLGPSRSVQPVVNDEAVVLLDGWIYDHEAVARRAGVRPPASDAETLLQAYRTWGPDLTEHIEGEFAIAFWDRKRKQLLLIRDRIGARPLYWARNDRAFAFASELVALLQVPWVSREIDRRRIPEYLSFQVVHAPRTLLKGVRQLEPAHWLRVENNSIAVQRYWRIPYAPPGTPRPREGAVIESLQEAVEQAVRRRATRNVDAGLYLSGGLGSTAIAAAGRDLFIRMPTFTVSFADDPHPELPFAGRVARLLGLEHHEVVVGSAELASNFADTVATLGHPVGNPAAINQLLLGRAARDHVRMVFSGDGGEELFGGRMLDRVVRTLKAARTVGRIPGTIRRPIARLVGGRRGRLLESEGNDWVLDLGIGGTNLFTTDQRSQLLRDHALVRPDVRREVLEPFLTGLDTDPINQALHGYLRSNLGESSLHRADRTAAASGLDVRFPLLDRVVLERAAALPGSSKVRRTSGSLHTRWPLRALLAGVIPPSLVNRPKRGLPKPLAPWLAGPGRLFLENAVSRLREDPLELWRPEAIDALRAQAGSEGTGIRLWSLFIFDEWTRWVSRV